jgi:hypothetical protein
MVLGCPAVSRCRAAVAPVDVGARADVFFPVAAGAVSTGAEGLR